MTRDPMGGALFPTLLEKWRAPKIVQSSLEKELMCGNGGGTIGPSR